MIVRSANTIALSPLRRLLAAGAATLVLLLTVLAVSPQLHAGFHTHDAANAVTHAPHPANDDGCVISLFAGGVTAAPAVLLLAAPNTAHIAVAFAPRAEIFVSPPRYLLQPERGPPLG